MTENKVPRSNSQILFPSGHDFWREVDCTYKEERYSVRDNGEVLRYPHDGKRVRPTDNQWTLGKLNDKTGYMEIASVRVHRIVAIAFHGEQPTNWSWHYESL